MQLDLIPPYLADILGISIPQLTGILIPMAGIVLAGVIVVSGMYFHNRRREMWHETARLALEKGQPLPPLQSREHDDDDVREKRADGKHDVRGGMVLIAVGAGLWLMLGGISANLRYIGAIPAFIGVALLLYALLAAVFGRKNQPPQDAPPRS